MLEAISWKEYCLMMGGATVVYYGWWVVKYRASLGGAWLKPKDGAVDGRLAALKVEPIKGAASAGVAVEMEDEALVEEVGTGEPAGNVAEDAPAEDVGALATEGMSVGAALFLSEVAGEVLKAVRKLAEAAGRVATGDKPEDEVATEGVRREVAAETTVEDEVLREKVLEGLKQLLGEAPYCRLQGTVFQGKVTEDIVRMATSLGFTGIDAKVVSALWDG